MSYPPEPPEVRAEAVEQLTRIRPDDPSIPFEHRTRTGDAAEEITALAREAGCDLIVMGTHGRTGLARWLMGSVAEKVLRHALCPVLTVKTPTPLAETAADSAPVRLGVGTSAN